MKLTKKRFFFNWKSLPLDSEIVGLLISGDSDIKGAMSIQHQLTEQRLEINLLAVSRENVILKNEKGKKTKEYEKIAANLIAFAVREAIKRYGEDGCVSLVAKTELEQHYCQTYGMVRAGKSVALFGPAMFRIVNDYLA